MARRQLRLEDGRRIDYLELGDPSGHPALYLHGTPSSASEARWLDRAAQAQGVRLVSLDRPGYLHSDPHPNHSLLGVAEDIGEVARALSFERFAVVGFSGGAGYALATGHVWSGRVTVVHVGGGVGSLAGEGSKDLSWPRRMPFKIVAGAPAVARPLLAGTFGMLRRGIRKRLDSPAEAALWFFEGPAKGAQVEAVADYVRTSAPEDLRDELTDYAAGTRATRAIVNDVASYVRPWPFDLSNLSTRVEIWHGRDDPAAPIAAAERLASQLPNAQAHFFDGEGHFVFHTHAEAVADSIRERS
jgi:pimeloyl-ACP methyl ester carboxylesterase